MRAFLIACSLLAAGFAVAQMPTPAPAAGPEQVESGPLVNWQEGRNVVVRQPDGTTKVYPVPSNLNWPPEMGISGWVNVYFVPLEGGGFRVTRLTTVPLTPSPVPPTPTLEPPPTLTPAPPEEPTPVPTPGKAAPKGAPVRLSMENAVTVTAIEPGVRITVRGKDGVLRTYLLDAASKLPPKLAVKQKVIVETKTVNGTKVVRRVVYPEIVISNVPKND